MTRCALGDLLTEQARAALADLREKLPQGPDLPVILDCSMTPEFDPRTRPLYVAPDELDALGRPPVPVRPAGPGDAPSIHDGDHGTSGSAAPARSL